MNHQHMKSPHLERIRREQAELRALRSGAAALGVFAGLAVGFFVAAMLVKFRVSDEFSPLLIFGSAALGGLMGFLRTDAGFSLFEAAMHYFIGYFSAQADEIATPSPQAPRWLHWALAAGVVCGVITVLVFGYGRWRGW